ncbi:MAG: hypothetical protein U0V87_06090 [Acidobacteriota bacterium]
MRWRWARRPLRLREGWVVGFFAYAVMRWFVSRSVLARLARSWRDRRSFIGGARWVFMLLLFAVFGPRCALPFGVARMVFVAPLLWTGWETLREWIPFPFPWGSWPLRTRCSISHRRLLR